MEDEIKEILSLLNSSSWSNEARQIEDYITKLEQENENHFKKNNELSTLNTLLRSDRDNYKSRINKAIEYIKDDICDIDFMKKEYGEHFRNYDIETTFKDIENLLNILTGGDE